ncbi:uncharacterized protein LOC34619102, partial [Cyclospora cayetanensis]|uniref:Uncharacterized protein LOC34619102 n=1 Tax=Cyclospora cayetanensis TaxID=88456 RepID=A0A6P6S266_9EIME
GAAASAARLAWLQARSTSSKSNASSASNTSSIRGVEEEMLLQLQQQRRPTLDEVLNGIQRLLQRQHTSFAHPTCGSSSSNASTSILPDEFVAFLSSAAAAASEQQQQQRLLADTMFQQLLQRLRSRLVGFSVPQLFRLLVALARLQHSPQEILSRMLHLLGGGAAASQAIEAPPLQQLTPRQLSQLPVLLAAATRSCCCLLSHRGACSGGQQMQQQMQQQIQQQHLAQSGLQEFLKVYAQHVRSLLQQQQLALGASAANTAASAADTAASAADTAASAANTAASAADTAAAGQFAAEDLCVLLIGLSSLGQRIPSFADLAADALRLQLALHFGGPTAPDLQLQQEPSEATLQQQLMLLPLSSVLLSMATLGVTNGLAILELSYQLTRVCRLLSPSQLADCLLALATLRTNPSAAPSLALLSELERCLASDASSCSASDAVTAAWAAVALQLHRGAADLLLLLLQQVDLLRQQRAFSTEDDWEELDLRLQQIRLEICLDPQAKRLREMLEREGLSDLAAAYPTSSCGEAVEAQAPEAQKRLEEEVEELLQHDGLRHRLLLTVDAHLQQQEKQQQDQEKADTSESSLRRVAMSLQFRGFPCLHTYRAASLFRWPSTAAAAAAAEVSEATGGTEPAAAVLKAEQLGGDSASRTLVIVGDLTSFADFEGPSEVYDQLKYRHLLRAGHALIAVRAEEWRAASGAEERLKLLVESLQLPVRS